MITFARETREVMIDWAIPLPSSDDQKKAGVRRGSLAIISLLALLSCSIKNYTVSRFCDTIAS